MRRVILDGRQIRSRDALHDVLTELSEETELVVTDFLEMKETLGTYGDILIRVLQDSAEENPLLQIILI